MMSMAEAREQAGSHLNDAADNEFRQALESATNSILNAEAFRKPYPLIRFRDFFPSGFYARLLQRFPDVDRFAGLNGDGTRREYALYDERSDPGSEESRELWSIVRRVLASTEVASALREKLDEGFRIRSRRSGEEWPVPMHPRPVLYTDLNGYAIKPHPDTRRKVLTMQIYLPSDDSQRELGTAIYKISPDGRLRLEVLRASQRQDRALPAELRLRLRRHPSGLFASEVELARAGGDCGSGREAAAFDPQHVLPRPLAAAERGYVSVSIKRAPATLARV